MDCVAPLYSPQDGLSEAIPNGCRGIDGRQPWPECGVTVRITPTVVVGASSCQSCRIQHSVPASRFPARREASAYAGLVPRGRYPLLRLTCKSNPASPPAAKQPDGQITKSLSSPPMKNIPLSP